MMKKMIMAAAVAGCFFLGTNLDVQNSEADNMVPCYSAGAGLGYHIFCGTCDPVYYAPTGTSGECNYGSNGTTPSGPGGMDK